MVPRKAPIETVAAAVAFEISPICAGTTPEIGTSEAGPSGTLIGEEEGVVEMGEEMAAETGEMVGGTEVEKVVGETRETGFIREVTEPLVPILRRPSMRG